MRDAAIVRMTLRELAPLHLGALAIGMLVAMSQLDDFRELSESPNTWPLCALPIAALWGGLTIGGGTKESLVHLLARPVSRVRMLAWRWGLLLAGLAIVALPLWWIGLHQFARGPDLWSIAIATVLASAYGAQGATLSEREPIAFAAAAMLGTAVFVPSHLAMDAQRLSWSRVSDAVGWLSVVPLVAAFLVLAAPVVRTWSRDLPVRSVASGTRHVLGSLVASLAIVSLIVWPALMWVGHPERGQLIAVVGATVDGPIVATGTRGEGGARDIVDGLVVLTDTGEKRVLWNRRKAAPDSTLWFAKGSPTRNALTLTLVDGREPDPSAPLYSVDLSVELTSATPNPAALIALEGPRSGTSGDAVFGELPGPFVLVHGLDIVVVELAEKRRWRLQSIRATEMYWAGDARIAISNGRIYAINAEGALWSAPVPWEDGR